MVNSLVFSSASKTFDLFKSSAAASDSDVSSCSEDEPDSPLSPASRIQAIVKKNPFAQGIHRAVQTDLDSALEDFEDAYCDSPTARLRARKVTETLEVAAAQFQAKPPTPAFHREAFGALQGCVWGLDLISTLKQFPVQYPTIQLPSQVFPRAINMDHIVRGEVNDKGATLGLHFCPPHSAARASVRDIHYNSETGVFCGTVQLPGGRPKFSTFFPDAFQTEEELINLIEAGVSLLTGQDGRVLFATNGIEPAFCFEVTLTREGRKQLITAAYPIFDCFVFQTRQTYQFTENGAITSTEILNRLVQLPKAEIDKICRYEYSKLTQEGPQARKVLDIAPLFPQLGIAKGIYVDIEADFAILYEVEMELLISELLSATIDQATHAVSKLHDGMVELCDAIADLPPSYLPPEMQTLFDTLGSAMQITGPFVNPVEQDKAASGLAAGGATPLYGPAAVATPLSAAPTASSPMMGVMAASGFTAGAAAPLHGPTGMGTPLSTAPSPMASGESS